MNELVNREQFATALTTMELPPLELDEELSTRAYDKLPLSRISALGVGLEPVVAAIQQVTSRGQAVSGYYKVTLPPGTHLAQFKNGQDYLGTALANGSNTIAGQSHLTPLMCNPTMLFMAATLASIDQKLDAIQVIQQEMLDIIVQKEKSALKGNLDFLMDVFNNYKYNWNNEKYKNANHGQVLTIRREAGQKIDFCREQIRKKLGKKMFLHQDKDVSKLLHQLQSDFKDYQMALYLYGFGYFLEILLQENYDSEYLSGISEKIDERSFQYRELYSAVYTQIESMSKSSLQTRMMKGLAVANKVTGEAIAKVPVLSKAPIDEMLIASSERLGMHEAKKVQATMMHLINHQSGCVRPFIDQINTIGRLNHQATTLIFNADTLYLGTE